LVLVVEHHPHRTFLQLFGIPLSCVHDSILSKDGASRKVGAIQLGIIRWSTIYRFNPPQPSKGLNEMEKEG
ncbi:MAG: hypothetical protein M0Z32_01715, partial [Actinomycetota bacterium]|nr:hypothetical protein [Actinomycetota bacterium]MCL6092889.1 hypothetical protein [Actinomycetota bacterium]MDA8166461.1 hypothetical protein [Actinomycetota bacterium]